MRVEKFLTAAANLTGTPVKDTTATDEECLRTILADDDRSIDHSQFNELLLLVNKDRMELPFFDHFFTDKCRVGTIADGVDKFQRAAILRYGNFIYAFRTLSRIKKREDFLSELYVKECTQYLDRRPRLLEIDPVSRADTSLVGYISPSEIIKDAMLCRFLLDVLKSKVYSGGWGEFKEDIKQLAKPPEHPSLCTIIENFTKCTPSATLDDFRVFLESSLIKIKENEDRLAKARAKATRNQDIYLTWDHMDVYFATSMRKDWEYEDLHDFIDGLMRTQDLAGLDLRYFNPTQSYTENRIDKGLVESLMLKRAECTVYSVQDTDTLGKDSELAATLAQGKPVIAYVPSIDVERRTMELVKRDPRTISERLRFVFYADEQLARELDDEDYEFVKGFQDLDDFIQGYIWWSLPDKDSIAEFCQRHTAEMARLCKIIANSEKRIYNKRAQTLGETHPLAIQVNLDTGVANGVLVVRSILDCARLLKSILTQSMEFRLEDKPGMWYLREGISGSIYRVVTKNRKLTNCFWNFYLRSESNLIGRRLWELKLG